jgi:hypothetical protein
MTEEDATEILVAHINKLVTAKLVPITGLIAGLEFALVHMLNLLNQRGVLTREEALASLSATREGLPAVASPEVARVFAHLERGLQSVKDMKGTAPSAPEDLRSQFQLIQGGLSEEGPSSTDRSW